MKTVAAVATIFGMVGAVAAQNPCCDPVYILQAKFANSGKHERRLVSDARHRALQAPPEDSTCKTRRAPLEADFDVQPTTGGPYWMMKGDDTIVEEIFTRAAADMANEPLYWNDATPGAVTGEKVVVIRVDAEPDFSNDWLQPTQSGTCDDPNASDPCESCADAAQSATWTKDAVPKWLNTTKYPGHVLILTEGAATEAGWNAVFEQGGGNEGDCDPATCNIAVAAAGTNGVLEDVKTYLAALDSNKWGSCDICKETSSSTSSSSSSTTTTAAGGNPPATTAAATTTTADGNSAGRLVAGMVPVATAALLALVM